MAAQFRSQVSLLIETRWQDKFGTSKMGYRVRFFEIDTEPLPATEDKDSLAILLFNDLQHGE